MKPVDTAIIAVVGPVIDDTDFKTLETGIAYDESGMSVDLFIETADGVTKTDLTLTSGGAQDWTHKGNGYYEVEITAAQNATEGTLWVGGVCDDVLPFESPHYQIVPQDVYDSLVAGSDSLTVDLNANQGGVTIGLTSQVSSLGTDAKNHVNAEVDTALADYDPPTQAELDAAVSAIRGADSDTLETLSDQIDAVASLGDGAIQVDHDTGGTDNLAYKTAEATGIDGATVLAFTQANWDAGNRSDAHVEAQTSTDVNGRWQEPMRLDAATYVFHFSKQGQYGPDTQEQAVS